VTKTGLFLTSFVAAIPGAALAYLMVMAFLSHSGGPSMWTKALAGMLLLIGALLAVMPFGIMVFAGPKTEKAPKKPKEEAAKEEGSAVVAAESEAEVEAAEAEEGSGSRPAVTDPNLEVVEANSDEVIEANSDDFAPAEGAEEAAAVSDDDSDFEVNPEASDSGDELFEAEEEEPKKGKKK
jgi:hypothetical protein